MQDTWGAQFARWRAITGLSQGQLGRLLDVDGKYVSKLECGIRNPSSGLARFVEVLQWLPDKTLRKLVNEVEENRYKEGFTLSKIGVYARGDKHESGNTDVAASGRASPSDGAPEAGLQQGETVAGAANQVGAPDDSKF